MVGAARRGVDRPTHRVVREHPALDASRSLDRLRRRDRTVGDHRTRDERTRTATRMGPFFRRDVCGTRGERGATRSGARPRCTRNRAGCGDRGGAHCHGHLGARVVVTADGCPRATFATSGRRNLVRGCAVARVSSLRRGTRSHRGRWTSSGRSSSRSLCPASIRGTRAPPHSGANVCSALPSASRWPSSWRSSPSPCTGWSRGRWRSRPHCSWRAH